MCGRWLQFKGLLMTINFKLKILAIIWLFLFSCNESPNIDFHSYQELSEYNFIRDGWFPEILKADAYNIRETYDVNNKHVFGKFEFSDKTKYDSIIRTYSKADMDALFVRIDKIDKPSYPEWFISKSDLNKGNYTLVEQMDFYLIMLKETNKIYYLR